MDLRQWYKKFKADFDLKTGAIYIISPRPDKTVGMYPVQDNADIPLYGIKFGMVSKNSQYPLLNRLRQYLTYLRQVRVHCIALTNDASQTESNIKGKFSDKLITGFSSRPEWLKTSDDRGNYNGVLMALIHFMRGDSTIFQLSTFSKDGTKKDIKLLTNMGISNRTGSNRISASPSTYPSSQSSRRRERMRIYRSEDFAGLPIVRNRDPLTNQIIYDFKFEESVGKLLIRSQVTNNPNEYIVVRIDGRKRSGRNFKRSRQSLSILLKKQRDEAKKRIRTAELERAQDIEDEEKEKQESELLELYYSVEDEFEDEKQEDDVRAYMTRYNRFDVNSNLEDVVNLYSDLLGYEPIDTIEIYSQVKGYHADDVNRVVVELKKVVLWLVSKIIQKQLTQVDIYVKEMQGISNWSDELIDFTYNKLKRMTSQYRRIDTVDRSDRISADIKRYGKIIRDAAKKIRGWTLRIIVV